MERIRAIGPMSLARSLELFLDKLCIFEGFSLCVCNHNRNVTGIPSIYSSKKITFQDFAKCLNMKFFLPSIPINCEHFVHFIYVNRHNFSLIPSAEVLHEHDVFPNVIEL